MGFFRAAAERAYRRLLALYPAEFRADFGEEMSLLFRDRNRDERLLPLVVDVLVDTLKTAPKEHLAMWSQDLRYALRSIRHNPGFTAIAAASLAIGVGANAAIFSLADALLLRPLPISSPQDVVSVGALSVRSPLALDGANVSYPDYLDFRDRSRSFAGLVAGQTRALAMGTDRSSPPRLTLAMLVTANFFDVLGVNPVLGRSFRPSEGETPGRDPVAVIAYSTWQSTFGGDPSVLGRTVRLNGVDLTVVGVTPRRFTGLSLMERPAAFVPLAMAPALLGAEGSRLLENRDDRSLNVKGRLAAGVTVDQAGTELKTVARALAQEHPATNKDRDVAVRTELQARLANDPVDAALIGMLTALVALVLFIACANVASLLLSRSATRVREVAVRLAIGASRSRLVRQFLTESLVLALLAGMLGLVLAYVGVNFFRTLPLSTDLPVVIDVRLDERVLLYSLGAGLLSVLGFGLVPALRAGRPDLVPSLKAGSAGLATPGGTRGRQGLVVVQVALSLVLLAASAAMTRGFQRTLSADPGFRTQGLLLASFAPTPQRFSIEQARVLYRRLRDEALRLPSVQNVTLSRAFPLSVQLHEVRFLPEGMDLRQGQELLATLGNVVGPEYFEVAGVPLMSGRPFAETDTEETPRVAIVNEEAARRYWPGEDPLGKRLRLGSADGAWAEIVGVARTHKYLWIGEAPSPFVYLPFRQSDLQAMTLMLLADGDPAPLAEALRETATRVAPDVAMFDVRTMEDLYLSRGVGIPRMLVQTVATMGLLGLGLAVVGLYGLMAYTVSCRTREIGIRMAIGAGRPAVLGMILRQGVGLALIGIGLGAVGSAAVSRGLASMISGVRAGDPVPVVLMAIALVAAAALATIAPASRAARIDPLQALRQE
jgi:putative ABC transport system permease protein